VRLGTTGGRIIEAALSPATPLLIFVCAAFYFASASPFSAYDFPLDDAWIHRVYSRSFASGHGFQYNDGGPQEAGATSPLWAVISAPAHWLEPLGTKFVTAAVKCTGAALGLAALLFFRRLALIGTGSRPAATVAASLLAVEPLLHFSALSGMETMLLVCLWLGSTCALVSGWWRTGLALAGLTPVSRPEAVMLLPLFAATALLNARGRASLARVAGWSLVMAAPMALWIVFCLSANGRPFPTTFYMKASRFSLSADHLLPALETLFRHGWPSLPVFFAGAGLFILISARRDGGASLLLAMVVAPVLYLAGAAGTRIINPDGYYWTRWIDPAAIVLSSCFCTGYGLLLCWPAARAGTRRGGLKSPRVAQACVILAAACGIAASALPFSATFWERRTRLASDSRAINIMNVQPGKWISDHTAAGDTIAVNDAGALRYFGGRRTIDLMGLNNSKIAFSGSALSLDGVDWAAVFPSWFAETNLLGFFEPRMEFGIPPEEYTVCDCPSQTRLLICEKKAGHRAVSK
jgi:hypothetical protein